MAVLAVELAAVSLAEVAPAVLAVALLAAVQLAAWRGIRSGAVAAVQVAASLEPLPWWPPAQEPRFLLG